MPKAEFGTPKWVANQWKIKGLQKLRWYCQMCEKQCRDENGFKCHRMSEGHQRQMQLFCENPDRFMDQFSRDFERSYMKLVSTRYCRTRVHANQVYQEMISDKQHVHMNSTIWVTLTEFVLYLQSTGRVQAERTPKGWYITYVDQKEIERKKAEDARRKAELTEEERHSRRIQSLVDEAAASGGFQQKPEYTGIQRHEGEVVKFEMAKSATASQKNGEDAADETGGKKKQNILKDAFRQHKKEKSTMATATEPRTAMERLRIEQEEKRRLFDSDKPSPSTASRKTTFEEGGHGRRLRAWSDDRSGGEDAKAEEANTILEKDGRKRRRLEDREETAGSRGKQRSPSACSSSPWMSGNGVRRDDGQKETSGAFDVSMGIVKPQSLEEGQQPLWIEEDLMVKIMDRHLDDGGLFKTKGLIVLVDKGAKIATVRVATANGKSRAVSVHQDKLETVIPNIGGVVKIVGGRWRGRLATLKKVHVDRFCASVEVQSGTSLVPVEGLQYEEICKVKTEV